MQAYEKLLAYTYESDIILIQELCNFAPAFSLCVEDDCAIFMDEHKLKTAAEKTVALAHELGHCETGAFYNEENPLDIYGKRENQANRWAVDELVPWGKLQSAFDNGIIERWELAEHFDIPEYFVDTVIDIYRQQGKI